MTRTSAVLLTRHSAMLRPHRSRLLNRRQHAAAASSPRVLVVGGGPVGLAMGYLLDRVYGVPTRVIDRQAQPTTHPQAHFLNLRTLEVLKSTMPAFHDRLLDQAAPSELWRDYIYTTGIGKTREFAKIDQFGSCIPRPLHSKQQLLDALSSISPTQFLHFPQNRFETMLSSYVEESGLHVEREVELTHLHVGDKPRVRLLHKRTQRIEDATFDYVIGADGAHSLVRELSGIEMVGARNLQSIVNVHFTCKTLSAAAREHPGMLYFVFNENVIGVLIAHDLHSGEWVFQIPFFPPQESLAQDFSVTQCKAIVRHLLPPTTTLHDDDIDILSVGQWQMSARVAKQYDRDCRVFLVGDAAHQFPPAGGFGMNTGVQDAHNLAWKLALAVQNGAQSPVDQTVLLRSYERERQHAAKINTQLSLRNVERTMKIPSALNVSHNNAKILAAVVNSAPVKFLPLALQREAIQSIMKIGKKPLSLLDNATSALGERMRRHVGDIVAKRSSLGMLFYHFDIGFSYDTKVWGPKAKALMQDAALNDSAAFATREDESSPGIFSQEIHVGGRFPHLWCLDATTRERLSTVELADSLRRGSAVKFALVVAKAHWTPQLIADLDADVRRHVQIVLVGDLPHGEAVKVVGVSNLCVDTTSHTSNALWSQFTSSYSAALVRPDGHIGALWGTDASSIDGTSLKSAITSSVELSH